MDSAEVYDPATNNWSDAGSMGSAHSWHTATRLNDGRVLVAGGIGGGSEAGAVPTAGAEVYDPSSNAWAAAAAMTTGRATHAAVLLETGDVLVTGGTADNATALSSAEFYDPLANTWTLLPEMDVSRQYQTMTRLGDGQVLVAGGADENGPHTSAILYDRVTHTWAMTVDLNEARAGQTAVLLGDGRVLTAGGSGATFGVGLASAEIYTPGLLPPTSTPTATATATGTPTETSTATITPTSSPTPPGPPSDVDITSPADGDTITTLADVVGTASSPTLDHWTLEYRLLDDSVTDWTEFASGTTSVVSGVLASFDPTLLLNGLYDLRFTAVDTSGQFASLTISIAVEGQQKIGTVHPVVHRPGGAGRRAADSGDPHL